VSVGSREIRGASDIFAIEADMGVGGNCAMIDCRSLRRQVASQNRLDKRGRFAVHALLPHWIAAQNAAAGESRIIATGWSITNCTSNWNGKAIRIDSVEPHGALTRILQKVLVAFSGNREKWLPRG